MWAVEKETKSLKNVWRKINEQQREERGIPLQGMHFYLRVLQKASKPVHKHPGLLYYAGVFGADSSLLIFV
ncbi:MAG: hypothetical protein JXA44_07215 [Methanospirillaceae archaeon]|nr:hypothetical protein [Methanospirillaceae archaeon]